MKKRKISIITASVLALTFGACKTEKKAEKVVPGIVLENMDTSVKPTDDFYRYVNGKWLDKTEIPADRSTWGGFGELRKKTDEDVLVILDDAIKNKSYEVGSDQEKAVNLYESIMDVEARNKQGVEPLKPILAKIEAIKTKKDIEDFINETASYKGNPFFGFGVFNDMKNSKMNAGYLGGGSLGLSRDYLVDEDEDTKGKRKKYEEFVSVLFQKIGDSKEVADKNAEKVLAFEVALAKPRMTKEESRDARKKYNPMTVAELQKLCPAINWNAHFKALGVTELDKVIVTDPNYFKAMSEIFKNSSVENIKTLLRAGTINGAAGYLTTELEKINWEFYAKTLSGAKEQRPRKERALALVNGVIGEALGKLYVAKRFPPEAKKKAEEMIANVRLGFKKRIAQLTWMSEETKKKAVEKLDKLTVKIAYPDKWKDYSKLQIKSVKDGGVLIENLKSVREWAHHRSISKLGKPVDKTEWGMSPQTVNAYFSPLNNEIVFPAAILQPPFYNYQADEAVNYGGIGAVIGHEISHSFDDSGARFDGDGNLNNWWTKEDAEKFAKVGGALIKQYDDLVAVDDVHVNGTFTLGENIGDLGGVQAAYEGLQIFLNKNGRPEKIDGFTPEQRFFLSWATVWRTKSRDQYVRNQVKTDPHAPAPFRGYVPLKNVDAFYKAFDIKEGDKMYLKPEDRVRIW
ncbi:MAG: M13 family metallopeptidase [Tenacibaculum sp.]|nr:M13 family metallopeptidase [Tenacibaculum sp.]